MYIGIDVGSTTVKVVLTDENNNILFKVYRRHFSEIDNTVREVISEMLEEIQITEKVKIALTGSAGMGIAESCNIPFVQEVYATQLAVKEYIPDADVAIELGGEDAKIVFFTGSTEYRMNGSCAGGTGSFIDQMATLLNLDIDELDALSLQHKKLYNIASRCGVFAKSDIQPLLNQGAEKSDLAASIYQSVVEQTIGGLAQGREIKGKVVFLGGPLTYLNGLKERFVETLNLTEETAVFHKESAYFVALGACLYAKNTEAVEFELIQKQLESLKEREQTSNTLPALFKNDDEYNEFVERHSKNSVKEIDINEYCGDAYLGIDVGSTTTKMILVDNDDNILYKFYSSNNGNPVVIVKEQLEHIYELIGDKIKIISSAVVGYGEELVKAGFGIDFGTVETVAHYKAAKHFNPDVDFIIDIGGQDIKCFDIENNAINNIMLNEACSSGCGSFIQTYANSLGYVVQDFAEMALTADAPIELGSRCTVFMNSAIKQAQKEGASVGNISAGLAYSVIQNALYKVIRVTNPDDLGKNIVVQGGTFLNDAILRCFELELGKQVTRPSIAGLMGAYGACLHAKNLTDGTSTLISKESLKNFEHKTTNVTCNYCSNKCSLTINKFSDNRKFISGNRCERPNNAGKKLELPNLYQTKLEYLSNLKNIKSDKKIGIPFGLNIYELLPFWQTFFNELGYEVVTSTISTRETFKSGQHTIPSDTVCYPAKLMHGHVIELIESGIENIFYPCMTYNFDEKLSDNHYNCPVVAYYPELLSANVDELKNINYMKPHFGLHREKDFTKRAYTYFKENLNIPKENLKAFKADLNRAVEKAYASYNDYLAFVRNRGEEALAFAKDNNKLAVVLAGRPYHIDPEVNHGLDSAINSYDLVVLTEDSIAHLGDNKNLRILNQWTYHARMLSTANFVANTDGVELIQIVSFGCGIDAITSDEIKRILSDKNKIYTQLKIDEISNLGTAKIRIRSLLAALSDKERNNGL